MTMSLDDTHRRPPRRLRPAPTAADGHSIAHTGRLRRFGSAGSALLMLLAALLGSTALVPTPASAAPQGCASVAILGLRGSGQTSAENGGFGPQVAAVVHELEQKLNAAGRTTVKFPIEYTAASANLLKPKNLSWPWKAQEFLASVDNGANALYTTLDLRSKRCRQETAVVIGYSQGAMAIRLALRNLANRGETALLARIVGIGLVADPTKRPSDPNVGNAPANSTGIATTFRVRGAPVAIPNAVLGFAAGACQHRDPVCDFSTRADAAVHTSYPTSVLRQLAQTLAPRVARHSVPTTQGTPPPAPPQGPPSAPPGGGNPQVRLAQGQPGPSGYRYAITLSGFPAGAQILVACFDSADPDGFYSFSIGTDGSGAAATASACYSGDGPDHWVTAGGATSNHVTWGGSQPPPPQPPAQPVFTVMNTSETPPDGVWFRNSPRVADTNRITGHGVYANDRVRIQCHAWGDTVGSYSNRLWYRVDNVTRPTVPTNGAANNGYLNAHYVNDGLAANQVASGVPAC